MQVALCEGKGEADLCNSMLVGSGGECTIAHTGIVAGAAAYPRTTLHRSALCVPVGGRRSKSFFTSWTSPKLLLLLRKDIIHCTSPSLGQGPVQWAKASSLL